MSTMYPGIVNSPATELDAPIDSAATTFTVINGTALPDAPNLATIGQGEIAETILYLSKSGNTLSDVTRGFEGTSRNWDVSTRIARTFTHYDYEAMRQRHIQSDEEIAEIKQRGEEQGEAIGELQNEMTRHVGDSENPHGVTKEQVELGNVPNYPAATQAQAEAGTNNASLMTPQLTTVAIDSRTRYEDTKGTATALTLTFVPPVTKLFKGLEIKFKLHLTTGPNPTLNVDNLGAKAMYDFSGEAGKVYTVVYDGADFIQASGGSGAKLNVFTGLTEPTKKEGIWIKQNVPITSIRNDLELWFGGQWNNPAMLSFADIPEPRYDHAVAVLGNYVHLVGGNSGSADVSTHYRYDTVTNTWTTLAPLPANKSRHSMAAVGGYLYVMGGQGSGATQNLRYDPIGNVWTELAPLPVGVSTHAAVAIDQYVYLALGGNSGSRAMLRYDTIQNSWTFLALMPEIRSFYAMAAVGTKVYVIGGSSGSSASNTNYCYDTVTNTWATLAPTPTATQNQSCAAVGTKIHIMGTVHYVYDTVTNTWSSEVQLPATRSSSVGAYLNNRIYILGGSPSQVRQSVIAYMFNSKAYPAGTVIIYRTNAQYGVYASELVTPSKPLLGVNTRMLVNFDNVYIHDGADLLQNAETYIGTGTAWQKIKGV